MQNRDQKRTDVVRSVLPSTARRRARATRRAIHRSARRRVAVALAIGGEDVVVDIRSAIDELVWERRAADKVAPLVRWALHTVAVDARLADASLAEQVAYFGAVLPGGVIGRHVLSHIEWALEWQWRAPRPTRRASTSIEPLVRALYEAGYHGELNHRLKIEQVRPLTGAHAIGDFARAAGSVARDVVWRLAREVGVT